MDSEGNQMRGSKLKPDGVTENDKYQNGQLFVTGLVERTSAPHVET